MWHVFISGVYSEAGRVGQKIWTRLLSLKKKKKKKKKKKQTNKQANGVCLYGIVT